jgi:hypothetical protein
MDELREIPGSCACVLRGAPSSLKRISGFYSLLDSETVGEVRSYGAERRGSRALIGVRKHASLRWQVFQLAFLPLHSFISSGERNSAV